MHTENRALRILYLTDKSDRGESAMIMGVRQQGHEVQVFGKCKSPHIQRIHDSGIPVKDVRWNKKLDLKVLRAIRQTVLQDGIDIIHTGNSRTTLHMVMASKKLQRMGKSPKLIAYLGVTGNVTWWSPLSWVRFLNPRLDRIICVAEGVRQYLLQDVRLWGLKLDPEKVVTIYKGHKLEWYQSAPADLGQFGIPANAMVVTVASRLRPRKGIAGLVRALGLCPAERNIHLLFLGHEGNAEILAEVDRLPHPERVHFGGYRQDAPAIMAASDVCCLPVLSGEGLSRAVIEGMAYGICPLVTPVGGNTELVIDGECGLVVPAGDEQALANAMQWLYDHPEQRRRMGAAARLRIEQHFHSDETVRQTLALYHQVMAE